MATIDIHNQKRLLTYCSIVLICSLFNAPEEYKVHKSNLLNQWFVKLGWFWTLILIIPLQFIGLDNGDREGVSRSLLKIIASSILWFISVNLFQFIDETTGFDISGHTFLLIFSNLILTSELYLFDKRQKELKNESKPSTKKEKITDTNKRSHQQSNNLYGNWIPKHFQNNALLSELGNPRTIRISAMLLIGLWDFMLIQTALFYHTLIQKMLALIWAIGSWYLLQMALYKSQPTILQTSAR